MFFSSGSVRSHPMKIRTATLVLLTLLLPTWPGTADDCCRRTPREGLTADQMRESLRGLRQNIVVVILAADPMILPARGDSKTKALPACHSSESEVRAMVSELLQARGVPMEFGSYPSAPNPALGIHFGSSWSGEPDGEVSCSVQATLWLTQTVTVDRPHGPKISAVTWMRSGGVNGSAPERAVARTREQLLNNLSQFASDYLAANLE